MPIFESSEVESDGSPIKLQGLYSETSSGIESGKGCEFSMFSKCQSTDALQVTVLPSSSQMLLFS